jgi:hypothetical protein
MGKVFTKKEIEEMEVRTLDALTDAIKSGDKERALELADRMYAECSYMHDLYVSWTTGLMDFIYKDRGEDSLYQALRVIIGAGQAARANRGKMDYKQRVSGYAKRLRGHLGALEVEEDDEKVSIKMKPCGSGQRLLESGAYGPPRNLSMIQKPHPMTWGLTNFPIYCTHSPVLEILAMEWLGFPSAVAFPAEKMGTESCTYCIYKDPKDIPEEVYTRVGKQKPVIK